MSGFYFGTLISWFPHEHLPFGEILPDGGTMAPVIVHPAELNAAGVLDPRPGMRFMFRVGATAQGNGGAVDLRFERE